MTYSISGHNQQTYNSVYSGPESFASCYCEISPFLMRISRAILHVSQSPQKAVITASFVIVPCGQKVATQIRTCNLTVNSINEICRGSGFSMQGKLNISYFREIFVFHKLLKTDWSSCI